MIEAHVCVLGEPVAKERPRLGRNGNVYTPAKTRAYETAVALTAKTKLPRFRKEDRLIVTLHFHCGTGKTKDLDNFCKSALDGLEKAGTFKNDSQIVELHAFRHAEDSQPRTEISVRSFT